MIVSGVATVGGARGDLGVDHVDKVVQYIDDTGRPVVFRSIPQVVATIDKQGGQDGVGWSIMLLGVTRVDFAVRVRSAYPSMEGNPGWNGNVGFQWIAYSAAGSEPR